MSANASERIDQLKEVAGEVARQAKAAVGGLKNDFSGIKDDVVGAVRGAVVTAYDGAVSAEKKVVETVSAAGHAALDAGHAVKEKGAHAIEELEETITKHPIAAIMVAGGIGLLLGLALRRRR
jgi:ElaB/YqjD/DUF883 family membrane-anchored ribosome-binding protein